MDAALGGSNPGTIGPCDLCRVQVKGLSCTAAGAVLDLTVLNVRDPNNQPLTGAAADDGLVQVDLGAPTLTAGTFVRTNLPNNGYVKNGDTMLLTATIQDACSGVVLARDHGRSELAGRWHRGGSRELRLGDGSGHLGAADVERQPRRREDGLDHGDRRAGQHGDPRSGGIGLPGQHEAGGGGERPDGSAGSQPDRPELDEPVGRYQPRHLRCPDPARWAGATIRSTRLRRRPIRTRRQGRGCCTLRACRRVIVDTTFPGHWSGRDIYYYQAFVFDKAYNYGGGGGGACDRATSYWLGDVDPKVPSTSIGDGRVQFSYDVTDLSASYYADGGSSALERAL